MSEARRAFVLEIDAMSEPIQGRLTAGATSREFVGWVGLAAALERLLDGPPEEGPSRPQEAPPC